MDNRQRKVLEQIFAHPVRHDIDWTRLKHLFEALGAELSELRGGRLKVRLAGQETTFSHPNRKKQVQRTGEVLAIRRFLETAGITPAALSGADATTKPPAENIVVVFTEREIRIYDAEAQHPKAETSQAYDPRHLRWHFAKRHAISHYTGRHVPENPDYCKKVATALEGARQILLLDQGQRHSDALLLFLKYLAKHHPEIKERIVGAEVVDVASEKQMLAHARGVFHPDCPQYG